MVEFQNLDGEKLVSNKQNNGDFDYYLVIETVNMQDATGEKAPDKKYCVILSAISPDQVEDKVIQRAFECSGFLPKDIKRLKKRKDFDITRIVVLYDYAGGVPCWQASGADDEKLVNSAKEQAQCVVGLFGFYMDKIVNRIGETGWERLKLTGPSEIINRVMAEQKA